MRRKRRRATGLGPRQFPLSRIALGRPGAPGCRRLPGGRHPRSVHQALGPRVPRAPPRLLPPSAGAEIVRHAGRRVALLGRHGSRFVACFAQMPLRAVECNARAGDSGPERSPAVRATGLRGGGVVSHHIPTWGEPAAASWMASVGSDVREFGAGHPDGQCSGTAWDRSSVGGEGTRECWLPSGAAPRRESIARRATTLGPRARLASRLRSSMFREFLPDFEQELGQGSRRHPDAGREFMTTSSAVGPTAVRRCILDSGARGVAMLGEVLRSESNGEGFDTTTPTTWRRERWN